MCTVVIFIKPNNDHPDPSQDWRKFKLGDVIDVLESEDGIVGMDVSGPRALGWFATIIVPSVPASDLISLCTQDVDDGTDQPRRLRVNKIDVPGLKNALTPAMKTALQNNLPVTVTGPQLLSFRSVKPPVTQPSVIGTDPKVIG